MAFNVTVTQEDLENAVEFHKEGAVASATCPIALAIKRRYPYEDVAVCVDVAFIGPSRFWLDSAGIRFVKHFDSYVATEVLDAPITPQTFLVQ